MATYVEFRWFGADIIVAINPDHVVTAQEFDGGERGIGTILRLPSEKTVNVQGSLRETLGRLRASQT